MRFASAADPLFGVHVRQHQQHAPRAERRDKLGIDGPADVLPAYGRHLQRGRMDRRRSRLQDGSEQLQGQGARVRVFARVQLHGARPRYGAARELPVLHPESARVLPRAIQVVQEQQACLGGDGIPGRHAHLPAAGPLGIYRSALHMPANLPDGMVRVCTYEQGYVEALLVDGPAARILCADPSGDGFRLHSVCALLLPLLPRKALPPAGLYCGGDCGELAQREQHGCLPRLRLPGWGTCGALV